MKLFQSLTLALLFLIGCSEKKKFKIEYYDHGHLMQSEGYYLNNKPVDTLKTFFRNGQIKSIEVYNLQSQLNGQCQYFFKNGNISELIFFINGRKNGRYLSYLKNGVLLKEGFFYEDRPMGDAIYYDSITGKLERFDFSDFENRGLMICDFDSLGAIKREEGEFFFIDSFSVAKVGSGIDTATVLLLISHRPKSSMRLRIESVDGNGKVIFSKNIDTKEKVVICKYPIIEKTDAIRTVSVRYDSIQNKSMTFITVRNDLEKLKN